MPRINQRLDTVTDDDMAGVGAWRAMEAGEYRFLCEASDYKPANSGDGMVLHLEHRCVEPDRYAGKQLRDFLTLEHSNSDTVRIARAKLKQLAVAIGHANPDVIDNSEELHNVIFIAQVGVETAKNPRYGDADGNQNRIVCYKPLADASGTTPTPPRPQSEAPQPESPIPAHAADDVPF